MNLVDKTDHQVINFATAVFVQHYKDAEFLERVKKCGKFNHTKDSADTIAKRILSGASTIHLKLYKEFSARSKCVAYTTFRHGITTIFFNKRKLGLVKDNQENISLITDRINTLMHEVIHTLGYTHKGNRRTDYNLGTAPYKIGAVFVQYLKDKNLLNQAFDNQNG